MHSKAIPKGTDAVGFASGFGRRAFGSFQGAFMAADDKEFLERGILACKEITKRFGTSYYFATQFFPPEVRDGVYAVYAFARIPDEIVDDPEARDKKEVSAKLQQWRQDWLAAMRSGRSDDLALNAIAVTFHKFGISVEVGEAFLRSMFLDQDKSRYSDYEDLEDYMYGSAGVIGLMVTRIVGYSSDTAFLYAAKLGYDFQLTNFLRDIREDYEELGRIYMPQDELQKFGLSERDIAFRVRDERFVEFMNFQIARNRQIYREALPGIKLLHWRGRLAVRIAYVLYKAILREIERANYNVYAGRVRINFGQKLWLSLKAVGGYYE